MSSEIGPDEIVKQFTELYKTDWVIALEWFREDNKSKHDVIKELLNAMKVYFIEIGILFHFIRICLFFFNQILCFKKDDLKHDHSASFNNIRKKNTLN